MTLTFLLWNEAKVEDVCRHRRLYSRPAMFFAALNTFGTALATSEHVDKREKPCCSMKLSVIKQLGHSLHTDFMK